MQRAQQHYGIAQRVSFAGLHQQRHRKQLALLPIPSHSASNSCCCLPCCAVLLGDIGKAARGEVGRTLVYCVIYSLDATRCIILQLAATQSLSHALGAAAPAMWQCGLVVVLLAGLLSQVRAAACRTACLRLLTKHSAGVAGVAVDTPAFGRWARLLLLTLPGLLSQVRDCWLAAAHCLPALG